MPITPVFPTLGQDPWGTVLNTALGVIRDGVNANETAIAGKANTSHTHAAADIVSGTIAAARLPTSSTTASGIVELATSAETTTGTDTTRATTPAGVKAVADTKANTSHTHAAADITSGTIATARLGSGTADATTFLRGDQTYAVPPGGGGATWGAITGTLSSQTDLQSALDGKVSTIADPNADRLRGWDDSAGAEVYFQVADGLAISGTFVIMDAANGAETVAGTSTLKPITPDGHRETWGLYYGINTQTGTTYAPVLDDMGKLVELSNAGAITVTLPSNATAAFPIGTIINFAIIGAGMATFVAGSGATLNVPTGLTAVSRAQYSTVSLTKRATDTWIISGDLAV